MYKSFFLCGIVVVFFFLLSCKRDIPIIDYKDYPNEVGKIIRGKCATSGCHNDASYEAAGGLNLSTWNNLFKGSRTGAVVIPYSTDYSSFLYFVNTYPDLGLTNVPVMPVNQAPLSREEVNVLKNWIMAGAPDRNGKIKFAENPQRPKFYVAHTACGVVAVFDVETRQAMRYIKVTKPGEQCTPHAIRCSADGKYWYVCFNSGGNFLRRYRTSDDAFDGEINIGNGEWNAMALSHDGKEAYVCDWSPNGKIARCDLENMKLINSQGYTHYPHGVAVSPGNKFLYATATQGNYIYKIDVVNGTVDNIGLSPSEIPGLPSNVYNPHEIAFSPDAKQYYVTCETEKTVRVFDAQTDQFKAVIPLSGAALEMSFAPAQNLLFVSSWNAAQFPGVVGAVAVINTTTNQLIKYINTGTQPHGIAVDEASNLVYVANRNIDVSGPVPHHSSVCGGRNGYLSFIDLATLTLKYKRYEVGVDPYFITVRP